MKTFISTIVYVIITLVYEVTNVSTATELVTMPAKSLNPTSSHEDLLSLRIVDDFLSDEQEIQEFLAYFEESDNIHAPSSTELYTNRFGKVRPSFVNRVLLVASHTNQTDPTCDDLAVPQDDTSVLMRTINTGSTPVHIDRYWDTDRTPVLDEVGFVFLNDNPDATFVYGSERIPAKKGSLVVFNGGVPHNTIVKSGKVNIVGPFKMDASLALVGGTPRPTTAPTTPAPTGKKREDPQNVGKKSEDPSDVGKKVEDLPSLDTDLPTVGKKGTDLPTVGKKGTDPPSVGKKGTDQPTTDAPVISPTTEAPVTEAPVAPPTTETPVAPPTTKPPVAPPTTKPPVVPPTTESPVAT
jgi:hypothetical protein